MAEDQQEYAGEADHIDRRKDPRYCGGFRMEEVPEVRGKRICQVESTPIVPHRDSQREH